jgi:hypothetical protein
MMAVSETENNEHSGDAQLWRSAPEDAIELNNQIDHHNVCVYAV